MMASALTKQKGALRKAMRATLANLTSDEIQAQSRQITRTLLSLPEFQQSKNVSCFLSMPTGEVDTSAVVSAIFDHAHKRLRTPSGARLRRRLLLLTSDTTGKTLYVPKMVDKDHGIMDFFQIFGEDDLRTLPSGQWGIREPEPEVEGKLRPSGQSPSRTRSDRTSC
ncbi:hypothetical protein ONZ51_g9842 [Trametes cubensis]|uniref:5-formyltetrahydrofolate cyclo-ligase n=1 Tax=Trametes cubensis TaxID=1111947 RepID=A0AAD7X7X7_9APHY|nr:hypothetical protein ONZ51_g9842 [Trametes cubensis]